MSKPVPVRVGSLILWTLGGKQDRGIVTKVSQDSQDDFWVTVFWQESMDTVEVHSDIVNNDVVSGAVIVEVY